MSENNVYILMIRKSEKLKKIKSRIHGHSIAGIRNAIFLRILKNRCFHV